jgi:hypothetical protein
MAIRRLLSKRAMPQYFFKILTGQDPTPIGEMDYMVKDDDRRLCAGGSARRVWRDWVKTFMVATMAFVYQRLRHHQPRQFHQNEALQSR